MLVLTRSEAESRVTYKINVMAIQKFFLRYFSNFLLMLFFVLSIPLLFSCSETTGPKKTAPSVTNKLLIYSDTDVIQANGGQAQILVKVYSETDTTDVASGVKVNFSASQAGTKLYIQVQNDITDENGYARATLFGGTRPGVAAVTSSIANFSNTIFITVTSGTGLVNATPTAILADGIATSTITATVIDSVGQPSPGTQVKFSASSGEITPQSFSDESGRAVAILRSKPSTVDISSIVTASTEIGKIAILQAEPDAAKNAGVIRTTSQSVAKAAKSAGVIGTTTVVFKGITVSGSVENSTIFANDADSTLITVTVNETSSGAPVVGAALTFTTNLGDLRAEQGATDSQGITKVILFGANVSGTAEFSAKYAEVLMYTEEILIIKNVYMSLESEPSVLNANGKDISTIRAYLRDADNNPVEGENIYFSTTLGTIKSTSATNEWGEATVSLRSSRFNGIAIVTARYSTLYKTTPVEFTGSEIGVLVTPIILVADGESKATLTVTLTDASNSPIVDGKVTLSTDKGTLYSADLMTSGASLVDSTSTEGKITSYLSSNVSGDVIVTVAAQGLRDSVTVYFTDYSFKVNTSRDNIVSGGDSVLVTATLKDKDGNIIKIKAEDVDFSPTLGTIVSKTENEDGSVDALLISGNSAGPSMITATIKDPTVSSSTLVTFTAADVGSIILEASKNSVRIGDNSINLIAKIFDITGNPKPGETVTFSIIKGPGGGERLDAGTAVTNELGQSVVSFISGMTGSTQNGVEVQARIGNIVDSVLLTITGQPETVVVGFDNNSFKTNLDGTLSITITAIISDVNRNKVVDGTIVNFSLIGDVGVISPEVPTVGGVAATTLIFSPSDAGKSVEAVASSGGKQDIKSIILPGSEGTVVSMGLSPPEKSILADGLSTTSFTISLIGIDGEPLSNQTVYATTDKGKVQATAVTGDPTDPNSSPGKATLVYTSMASAEDTFASVVFSAGGLSKTAKVNLKGITLISFAEPDNLPSDGQSESQISVLIKETSTHIPISDGEVLFGASDGQIGGKSYTNENGVAVSTFTAGYNPGTAYIMVNYGSTLIDTVEVNISEVTARGIELFANPSQIAANGISISTISVLLRDDNFNPISGEVIRFTTTLGTITASDSTDVNGRAEATLVSDRFNGEAIITATFKEHLTTVPVNFTGVKLNVSATPENLYAGGEEKSVVTAIVKDAAEVPIVGTDVHFEWFLDGEKKGEQSSLTNVGGRASINLSSSESGLALIRVQGAGSIDSTEVTFTRIRFTIGGEVESVSTGGEQMQVWAELFDTVNNSYVKGVQVNFYSILGSITSSGITNTQGKAYATLTSGNTAGTFTVSASTKVENQKVSAEKQFTFVNAPPSNISLSVDANIAVIGDNSSALIAIVTDQYGNPVSGALVSFKILQGPAGGERIHPATATTSPSGVATTYFYSGQVPSLFENVHLQAQVNGIISNIAQLTIAGAPETINPSFNTDWDIDSINNNDGTYTLPISAVVLDINSNFVVDGTTVYFKIDPPKGAVTSPVKTENSVAKSFITYPSANAGMTVSLTASAGGKEGSITFTLPGFTLSYLSATAAPKSIQADGKSTSNITATVFDKNGSSVNVPDGTIVSFTTAGGTLDSIVASTVDGVATTILTSDKNAGKYVEITAQSGIYQAFTWIYFEEVGTSAYEVNDIVLELDKDMINADGIDVSVITATLYKFTGDIVNVPTTVAFDTDIGEITNIVRSDSNGQAVAQFSSGHVGTATISAQVGNVISYTTINVIPGPPQSIELSFDPNYVYVQGSGKNETLLINAFVKDSKNNPVEEGILVKFELTGQNILDTEASITPEGTDPYESSPIPTLNGRATVSFHSGKKARAVRVKATIVDDNGIPVSPEVSSETTQFLVYSGPPYIDLSKMNDPFTESKMTIYCSLLNIFAYQYGTDYNKSTISVTIYDKYNNPVPAGTAVYFTTTGGGITTKDSFTDENGVATATLFGGNTLPTLDNSSSVDNPNANYGGPESANFTIPGIDFDGDGFVNHGIATITAYTEGLDHLERNATIWNYARVVFSGPVDYFDIQTDATLLNIGDSANLTITIYDHNGNPVVAGSKLTLSSTIGKLSNTSIVTDDPGTTEYYVSLTNNLNPLSDSPGNTVVTVKLESPNGNVQNQSSTISLTIAP
ncbi:Ig-like domain-containing protein [Candidatus Latescibacterota bacterium]